MIATILLVILWIILILLGLLLLVVMLPFHLLATGAVHEEGSRGRVSARWAFGFAAVTADFTDGVVFRLFGLRLFKLSGRPHEEREEEKEEKERKRKEKKKRKKEKKKRAEKENLSRRDIPVIVAMFRRVLRPLRPRGWMVGIVGLDDPADTAILSETVRQLDAWSERFELVLEPDWIDEVVDVEGRVVVRIWIAELLLVLLGLLLRRESRRVLRVMF